ncbi:MAG TPA: rhodanese-like domain-containing protein [Pirellulales bacterium]|jgi:rhodanese-related sulfurtransferase
MNAESEMPLEITCRSVKEKLDAGEPFLLIDCREADEYAVARIEGARLLPMSELATRLDELVSYRDQEVVIHCHHGGRSERVARWLRGQGYNKACTMAGGIDRWAEEIDRSVSRY